MNKILKNHQIIESPWQLIESTSQDITQDFTHDVTQDLTQVNAIFPLNFYRENRQLLSERKDVGIWLKSDELIEDVEELIGSLPLIALEFPVFTDGRPYSSARILRTRYGYEGEIRAIGDVRFDQLEQMYRCGFDAFEIANEDDLVKALSDFKYFSNYYQQGDLSFDPVSQAAGDAGF